MLLRFCLAFPANSVFSIMQTTDSSPSDKTSKKSTPDSSRTTPVEPLRIKVEDEDYFPDNEGIATPDSSQPSPRARSRKSKGTSRAVFSFYILPIHSTTTWVALFGQLSFALLSFDNHSRLLYFCLNCKCIISYLPFIDLIQDYRLLAAAMIIHDFF